MTRDAALRLLCRWRALIDTLAGLRDLDPASPDVGQLLSTFVELADDTDRFIELAADAPEAST